MLSLSKKTDYALLALSHLTRTEAERAVNTKEIAEQYGIPVELLAKILQKLAKAHLLVSTSGPTGGYRLARPAEQISVGSVIEIIDGPPALVPCMKTIHNGCEQRPHCTIRAPLMRINSRLFQMLNLITLAEINREEGEVAFLPFMTPPRGPGHPGEFARSLY
jgi:Rrf2 family protein